MEHFATIVKRISICQKFRIDLKKKIFRIFLRDFYFNEMQNIKIYKLYICCYCYFKLIKLNLRLQIF